MVVLRIAGHILLAGAILHRSHESVDRLTVLYNRSAILVKFIDVKGMVLVVTGHVWRVGVLCHSAINISAVSKKSNINVFNISIVPTKNHVKMIHEVLRVEGGRVVRVRLGRSILQRRATLIYYFIQDI